MSSDFNHSEIPRQHCGTYSGTVIISHSEQSQTELESSQGQLGGTL